MLCVAAAFGRLCVETPKRFLVIIASEAAAFGRLYVETGSIEQDASQIIMQPPSGGCVLKRLHHDSLRY